MKIVLSILVLTSVALSASGAVHVYDEFDGANRGGWDQAGLGEWSGAGTESGGMFLVNPNNWITRAFAAPLSGGTVWYALTPRVDSIPIGGGDYGTVSPSSAAATQWMELGFQGGMSTTEPGFPYSGPSGIDGTTLQTMVLEINLADGSWQGWAATGTGATVDTNAAPLKTWPATPEQTSMNALYLSTGMSFQVDRVCVADTLSEAVTPIPEPASILVALLGCLLFYRR